MASANIRDDNFKSEKLAIFTCSKKIDPFKFRNYVVNHWRDISSGLENNSTILVMGGVHGGKDGTLGQSANNLRDLENQVMLKGHRSVHLLISFILVHRRCSAVQWGSRDFPLARQNS